WVNDQLSLIAGAIGCSDSDVLAYVLANLRPTLSPFIIRQQPYVYEIPGDMQPIQRTEVTITVKARITSIELRELYRQLEQILNVVKMKALSAEDEKFLEVVRQIGDPPKQKGVRAFWEQVWLLWNAMEGVKKYKEWRNPLRRYTRLKKRM